VGWVYDGVSSMADDGELLLNLTEELPSFNRRKKQARDARADHSDQVPHNKRRRVPIVTAGITTESSLQQVRGHTDARPAAEFDGYQHDAAPRRLQVQHAPLRKLPVQQRPAQSVPAMAEVFGGSAATPANSFGALGVSDDIARRITALGFERPTRVQQAVVPHLLQRRDVLVRSDTGSGKTLSYLAPVVCHLVAHAPRLTRADGTVAIVLVPTRELALQVLTSLQALLLPFHWLVPGAVVGGENRQKEKARLRRGVTFLVATPGRLLDHLRNTSSFITSPLQWLVLDEADRLLDLGFEEAITDILKLLQERASNQEKRCTALLSATLPSQLDVLVRLALHDPLSIRLEHGGVEAAAWSTPAADVAQAGVLSIPVQLKQFFVQVPTKLRVVALVAALRTYLLRGVQRVIVFVSTCESTEFHAHLLAHLQTGDDDRLLPCQVYKLHGSLPQAERTAAFRGFQSGEVGILVCTDVAARGLDLPAVGAAVQLDPPGLAEDYVHRVGRTARVGHAGEAMLMLLPSERSFVQTLAARGAHLTEQPLMPLLDSLPSDKHGYSRPSSAETHPATHGMHRRVNSVVHSDAAFRKLAKDAFRSHVRAYAAHPAAAKATFHVKQLHLGHLATAFGLSEPPKFLGRTGGGRKKQNRDGRDR